MNNILPTKQDFIDRKVSEPLAVRLAGEYDVFDLRDPNAALFQHGLCSQDLSENIWDLLLVPQQTDSDGMTDVGTVAVESLLERGEAVQYAQRKQDESIIKYRSFDLQFEGLTFLALNTARCNSLTFAAGVRPHHDALLGFCFTGHRWRVSLYHAPGKEHHDLSQIATKYGGGGHKGACGFECEEVPWKI